MRVGVVYEVPPCFWRFGLRGRRRLQAGARVAIDEMSLRKLKEEGSGVEARSRQLTLIVTLYYLCPLEQPLHIKISTNTWGALKPSRMCSFDVVQS